MTERPSPGFTRPLLDAIRRGDKTQTRRANQQPSPEFLARGLVRAVAQWPAQDGVRFFMADGLSELVRPKHGGPGTVWYLKEPLRQEFTTEDDNTPNGCMAVYSSDGQVVVNRETGGPLCYEWQRETHASRSMPRRAARDFLTVADVRVERVQDISREDVRAEGVPETWGDWRGDPPKDMEPHEWDNKRFDKQWAWLWDSINAKKPGCSWDDNPTVWAYTFTYKRDPGREMPK